MSGLTSEPGWYHAQGDPFGSQRFWDGQQWQGGPRMAESASPAGWPEAANAVDASRSPVAWFLLGLSRWNKFEGRATRAEYWWFVCFHALSLLALAFLSVPLARVSGALGWLSFVVLLVFAVAMIIPSIAVSVRRLHDTNKSGWFLLLAMIPIVNWIGSIVLIIFYCIDGDRGSNQYGPSPKYALGTQMPQMTNW